MTDALRGLGTKRVKVLISTMSKTHDEGILGRFIDEMILNDGTPQAMARAVNDLLQFIENSSIELDSDSFSLLMSDLNNKVFTLCSGTSDRDKNIGVCIIDALIDFPLEDKTKHLVRFGQYLKTLLQQPPQHLESPIIKRAAEVLGHLVRSGGTSASDVHQHIQSALSWLEGERLAYKRRAACIVLEQLAIDAQTPFNQSISAFIDHIWVAIRDPKLEIRKAAVQALRSCLLMIHSRARKWRLQWYFKIWGEVQRSFASTSTPESLHGSLLVLHELLSETGDFMLARYKESCDKVRALLDDKNPILRQQAIELVPKLAMYSPNAFVRGYLHACIDRIVEVLRTGQSKKLCFLSLGQLALAAGSPIQDHVISIVELINIELTNDNHIVCVEALKCIGMLAQALGRPFAPYVLNILDEMLALDMSPGLIEVLQTISEHIPALVDQIQEQLMTMISRVLIDFVPDRPGSPVSGPGSPSLPHRVSMMTQFNRIRHSRVSFTPHFGFSTTDLHVQVDDGLSGGWNFRTTLALKTLGSFSIHEGTSLLPFLREYVVPYLDQSDPDVRMEAAMTCSNILVRHERTGEQCSSGNSLVKEILIRLLHVSVADSDLVIRQHVLSSFDPIFDRYLLQAECIWSLFMLLKDEDYVLRQYAIRLIGRLAPQNSSYVMPILRKEVIVLLGIAKNSTDSRSRIESARLIGILIDSAGALVTPYIPTILESLLLLLGDSDPAINSSALDTIGLLVPIGYSEIEGPMMKKILDVIVEMLASTMDPSRRQVALRSLGRLIEHTGYAIQPYYEYKRLLPMLLNILRTDKDATTRYEATKALGTLGALDPFKYKTQILTQVSRTSRTLPSDVEHTLLDSEGEGFFAYTVILSLLESPAMATRTQIIDVIMFNLTMLELKGVPLLPLVMTKLVYAAGVGDELIRVHVFQQLSSLVAVVRHHIKPYITDVLELIDQCWSQTALKLMTSILSLVESLSYAVQEEFKDFFQFLAPRITSILYSDFSPGREATKLILSALRVVSPNVGEHLDLILPPLLRLVELLEAPIPIRKASVMTITSLVNTLNFTLYAPRVLHPFVRLLKSSSPSDMGLRGTIMMALCSMVRRLGSNYVLFVPMVQSALIHSDIRDRDYDMLVKAALHGGHSGMHQSFSVSGGRTRDPPARPSIYGKETRIDLMNQGSLKQAWEVRQMSSEEDWNEWMLNFSFELVRQSPNVSIRFCVDLLTTDPYIASVLFNAAFLSCWRGLIDSLRDDLMFNIQLVFSNELAPPELLASLLGLAEYMERHAQPLPIDVVTLGDLAQGTNAYAKALHYREIQFQCLPQGTVQSLIAINNKLQQHESAIGVLQYAQQNMEVELRESWYEQLQRWEEALGAYERRQLSSPSAGSTYDLTLGRMRCLHSLGEYQRLYTLSNNVWSVLSMESPATLSTFAPEASYAAWNLGHYHQLETFSELLAPETFERSFFDAIISIRGHKYKDAKDHINNALTVSSLQISSLLTESYERAYDVAVKVQQAVELGEVIRYKCTDDPGTRSRISAMWEARLNGCQEDVSVWQSILNVRALVISPKEDQATWLKFADVCRRGNRLNTSHHVLTRLLGTDPFAVLDTGIPLHNPQVAYSFTEHLWAAGFHQPAFSNLRRLVDHISMFAEPSEESIELLGQGYLQLGLWEFTHTLSGSTTASNEQMLRDFGTSVKLQPTCATAQHWWGLINYQILSLAETEQLSIDKNVVEKHAVAAVESLFTSIAYGGALGLQDTLRLLSLWFKYGSSPTVEQQLRIGFENASVDVWLAVIPQIIARINIPKPRVQALVHEVLANVGAMHPQALIYPLTVAAKSSSETRKVAASSLLSLMRRDDTRLVEQASAVAHELIRVAVCWPDMVLDVLSKEASTAYFGCHDIPAMFDALDPMYDILATGPQTPCEVAFIQKYGTQLHNAKEYLDRYKRLGKESDLSSAWQLFKKIFQSLTERNKDFQPNLQLEYVSPMLLTLRDLELAVPGTYEPDGSDPVLISWFSSSLRVMHSLQKPRKLNLRASDGRDYPFLLKGKEDLRQDERVMQLMGLVNTLLVNDTQTSALGVQIRRYSAIPLAPTSGLIEWMTGCDTLFEWIKGHRSSKHNPLHLEIMLLESFCPTDQWYSLTDMQKLDIFEQALSYVSGRDLYDALWLKSSNSEAWVSRRISYTRSLAVMSMVGYVLGLGDRHPQNLMLDNTSGQVIHIDFGDCFEVTRTRKDHPEKVPFRLTRLLTNAMEVSGVEGNFRSTCHSVMRVLRDNRESVMAVLEAFVHDPLINWRLVSDSAEPNANAEALMFETTEQPSRGASSTNVRNSSRQHATIEGAHVGERVNTRALEVTERIRKKLTGKDFDEDEELDVRAQVSRLIDQATREENLSQMFLLWRPFW